MSTDGRGADGRFAKGNAGGPGNPNGRRTAELRTALLDAVTADDIRAIVGRLVAMARGGNLAAVAMLLDRVFGRPVAAVDLQADVHSMASKEFRVAGMPRNEAIRRGIEAMQAALGTEVDGDSRIVVELPDNGRGAGTP
jgi:hypothetical protein